VDRGLAILLAAACASVGCAPQIVTARTSVDEPERPRERDARERLATRRCALGWTWAFPGIGQLCANETAEGVALASLAAAEGAAAITAAATKEQATQSVVSTTLPDLWAVSIAKSYLDDDVAHHKLYAPEDSLGELVVAPFNPRVLKRPEVWAGLAVELAAGVIVSRILNGRSPYHFGDSPRVFGAGAPSGVAYPAAGAAFAFEFEHVALAEELVFRGLVQSTLARQCGEACGWALGAFIFGGFHATNAISIDDPRTRARYLAVGVPYLVLTGQYLGAVYWKENYSLTGSVAAHFWYDTLLSMIFYAADPRHSSVSGSMTFPL
jgi:membrane protease YdiL (CAAX protease family)